MKYCIDCDKKISSSDKFCCYCGQKVETNIPRKKKQITKTSPKPKSKNSKQNRKHVKKSFEIEIPNILGTNILRFEDDSMTYQETIIKYEEIDGISCKQISHSTNLIPTHQEFSFSFYGSGDEINLKFGTTLHIGSKSRKEIFFKLYSISKEFFAPIVVRKLVEQISKENETVQIGNVYFNKHGYYKKGLFGFGGENWVHWKDSVGEPGMESGSINLYKADGKKYKHFASISLDNMNAIVVPDLVATLHLIFTKK